MWLRMLSRGHKISKINEPLLLYRIHRNSVTGMHLKNANPYFKHFQMKMRFLGKFSHTSWFSLAVFGSAVTDLVKGVFKSIKKIFHK